jgi:hypothetical protein
MNNVDLIIPLRIRIDPSRSVASLLKGISIRRCPFPSEGIRPRFEHVIDVHRITIGRSCENLAELRHAMFDILLQRKLKQFSTYAACVFNSQHPMFQLMRPFVAGDYAFGMAGYDPFSDLGSQQPSSELSTIDRFARGGTSRHLVMLATSPTDVDMERFDGPVIERDVRNSMMEALSFR